MALTGHRTSPAIRVEKARQLPSFPLFIFRPILVVGACYELCGLLIKTLDLAFYFKRCGVFDVRVYIAAEDAPPRVRCRDDVKLSV